MFVVYHNHEETIVTTTKKEKKVLEEFFAEDTGRKLYNFERYTCQKPGVWITPALCLEIVDCDPEFNPPYED